MRTAPAASTCTRRGGSTRNKRLASWTSPAVITSKSAPAATCRASAPPRASPTHVGGYGKKFKQDMRRYYGSFISLVCRGEMIPNEDSYCDIDPTRRDQYGIPTLRFHWKWSEHEKRQALHSHKAFTEVIQNMGGRVTSKQDLLPGGFIIPEVSGAASREQRRVTPVVNQVGSFRDDSSCYGSDSINSNDATASVMSMPLVSVAVLVAVTLSGTPAQLFGGLARTRAAAAPAAATATRRRR